MLASVAMVPAISIAPARVRQGRPPHQRVSPVPSINSSTRPKNVKLNEW